MSVINTNITSMIGQQNLSKSQNALTTSMERLSSGLRINSAKDDAAGQAIANRMTSQITGLSQAQRNANDGISVAQTAEGALNQVNDNLQRIRELTVQAQNGTNSQSDLQSIQDEISQRVSEINRISEETSFNGVKVLSENQTLNIQVGSEDGQTISLELEQINGTTLDMADFNVNGYDGSVSAAATYSYTDSDGATVDVDITGATAAVTAGDATYTATGSATVVSFDDASDAAAGTAALVQDEDGDYFVSVTSGGATTYYAAEVSQEVSGGTTTLTVNYDSENAVGAKTASPLDALDSALSTVDSLRSDLGAIQNRFDSAITNLSTTETNLSSARSRIEDADYAAEVADMTRAQILQQAGTSVLAQANQVPQNVLSLLG